MSKGPRRAALARAAVVALTILVMTPLAGPLAACPSCDTGRQARSDVWNDDFAQHLLFAALPFLVIGAICVHVERMARSGRRT